MIQKRYMNIQRMKTSFATSFDCDDVIVIQEKIDGANFSIRYDAENKCVAAFSRNKELSVNETLRGAWQWSQSLDVSKVKNVLGENLIVFAEWLVPHTVKYPDSKYNCVYCYDVYDVKDNLYLSQNESQKIVRELDLTYVPVFYTGKFISWEHVKGFVGATSMGGKIGEGVVVKNMTKLNNPNPKQPFYVKVVSEQFCETKAHRHKKAVDAESLAERQKSQEFVDMIVTPARVQKLLCKMVDDGILREDWDAYDMGTIARNLGKAVYDDCQKEEREIVLQGGKMFGKLSASTAMKIAKEILNERGIL